MANKKFDPKHELREAEQELSVLVVGKSGFGADLAQIGLVEGRFIQKCVSAFERGSIDFEQQRDALRLISDEYYPENPITQKRDEAYRSYKN